VHDSTRPSEAFGQFIARVRHEEDDISLLFTSEPDGGKVKNYGELIYKVVPQEERADHGDVRLSYSREGEESMWVVEKHHITVT